MRDARSGRLKPKTDFQVSVGEVGNPEFRDEIVVLLKVPARNRGVQHSRRQVSYSLNRTAHSVDLPLSHPLGPYTALLKIEILMYIREKLYLLLGLF